MHDFFHSTVVRAALAGAFSGWASAAVVDFQAFKDWKCWHDAIAYKWSTASWRWLQGAVTGALTGIAAVYSIVPKG